MSQAERCRTGNSSVKRVPNGIPTLFSNVSHRPHPGGAPVVRSWRDGSPCLTAAYSPTRRSALDIPHRKSRLAHNLANAPAKGLRIWIPVNARRQGIRSDRMISAVMPLTFPNPERRVNKMPVEYLDACMLRSKVNSQFHPFAEA